MSIPFARVKHLLEVAKESKLDSLNRPLNNDEGSDAYFLGDALEDKSIKSPDETAISVLKREAIDAVLKSLSDREARIIRLRYGLEDGQARTLEEIGKEFGVARERIRQIEAKALRKLRHVSRSKLLKDFKP